MSISEKTKTMIACVAVWLLCVVLSAGCISKNTGCVSVNYEKSEQNGLVVTNFTDNPIFAHIYYDYSAINDFDESKIEVDLTYNPLPWDPVDEEINTMRKNFEEDFGFRMMCMNTLHPHSPNHWTVRPAVIKERRPGYIKIFALDDLGTYTLKYAR